MFAYQSRRLFLALFATGLLAGCSDDGPTAIEIPVFSIQVTRPCNLMIEGNTCRLGVEAKDEQGRVIVNPVLRFTANSTILSVDDEGFIEAHSPGLATIFIQNTTGTANAQTGVTIIPNTSK